MEKHRPRKRKYPTDTEAGIRPINVIRSLPSGELTDEEFVKEFFDRFEAKALIVCYTEDGTTFTSFGRLKSGANPTEWYRKIIERLDKVFSGAEIKEYD